MAYIGNLIAEGNLKNASPVEKGSKIVTGSNGSFTDHPFNDSKELIAGYFLLLPKILMRLLSLLKRTRFLMTFQPK